MPYESNLASGLVFGAIGNYIGDQGVARVYYYLTGKEESLLFGTALGIA